MISVVVSGKTIKCYINGAEKVSVSLDNSYTETGSHLTTMGYASDNSIKGYFWYFVILDNDSTSHLNFVSDSSSNCLTSSCLACNPAVNDPYLGIGCLSTQKEPFINANGGSCVGSTTYSCSKSGALNCANCGCGSCEQSIIGNICWCPSGCTASTSSCSCEDIDYDNWDCCDISCQSYASLSDCSKCITCKDTNAIPDVDTGCICINGYFGTKPLNTNGLCRSCNIECKSCEDSTLCLTCISNNASPYSSGGCICDDKYYNVGPLTESDSCISCHEECATCKEADKCLTCISLNAEPDSELGCKCKSQTYGINPLTQIDSCKLCDETCHTCSSSIACDICIDENSAILGSACECKNGYYRTEPIAYPYTCWPCHSDCLTCKMDLVCETCLDQNSGADLKQGCNCKEGFYRENTEVGYECLACDLICSECLSLNNCISCTAENAAVQDSGKCQCKTGYYVQDGLEYVDGCWKCTEMCMNCTDSSYFRCLECENWFVDGVCFMNPPIGYFCEDKICKSQDQAYLSFNFKSVGRVFYDEVNDITGVCCENNTGDFWDIVTSEDRGIFMFGTGGIEVKINSNYSLLGTQLVISAWLNTDAEDFVLSELGPQLNPPFKLGFIGHHPEIAILIFNTSLSTTSISPITPGQWNHLLVKLTYSNELSTLALYINGVQDFNVASVSMPAHIETKASFYIGSDSNNENSYLGFVYSYELYVIDPGIDSFVEVPANGSCIVHPKYLECLSMCNITQFQLIQTCLNCPSDCKFGCRDSSTCSLCADDHCKACKSFYNESCTQCEENFEVDNNLCSPCSTFSFYDLNSQSCIQCPELCETCLSEQSCTSCKYDSSVINGVCTCNLGFTQVYNKCIRNKFDLIVSTHLNNTLRLVFTKSVSTLIDESTVNITALNLKSYLIVKISSFSFNCELEFSGNIEKNAKAKVQFKSDIESIDNDLLSLSEYTASLFESDEEHQMQVMDSQIETAKAKAQIGSVIGISVAGAASLISGDLSSIFTFLNTAEMFYAIIFFDLELYPPFREFLMGIRVQSKLPNIVKLIFTEQNGVVLSENYKKYGFNTNLVYINCGMQFTFLIIFFVLWLIIKTLSYVSKLKSLINPILSYFQYSVFLRIWVQSYFDIMHASRVAIAHSTFKDGTQTINFCLSIILIVIFMKVLQLFGFVLLIHSISKLSRKNEEEAEKYRKSFATFYEDFKNTGPEIHLFYVLFIARRIILVFLSQFGTDNLIQIIVSIVLALTVIFI